METTTYDAIVIGSGISGGWAAKELCDLGVKTLVLERGRNVEHIKDYPTAMKDPWDFEHRLQEPAKILEENPVVGKCYAFDEATQHFFVKDKEHPYIQEKPFDWIRGYQVGGKSITWGRACQRWSNFEFSAPQRYGYAIDWPIRYEDIAPWYSHVEKFAGICGGKDGLEALPDGEYLPPFEMSVLNRKFSVKLVPVIKTGLWCVPAGHSSPARRRSTNNKAATSAMPATFVIVAAPLEAISARSPQRYPGRKRQVT